LIIESNNLTVVKVICNPWEIRVLLSDCFVLLPLFLELRMEHYRREADFVSDWTAKTHECKFLYLQMGSDPSYPFGPLMYQC